MTSFRSGPGGLPYLPYEFGQDAIDNPLGAWATLTGAAADTFLTGTPLIGSLVREAQTPELAKEPVAGGRGGVGWRDLTPDEVRAKGDKLYTTADEYKASDYYRTEIPWEKGLTESRAKVLSEFYDTSKIREFYSAKRPVMAFAGGILGSLPDPVNFIPIVRGGTAAVELGRLAHIARSAGVGAADAGLNSLIFQTALADQKARFGDDVSWQAILTNSAFSAMAGVVIGGGIGALSRGVKPKAVEAPKVEVPPSALSAAGEITGRFGEATRVVLPETQTTVDVSAYAPNVAARAADYAATVEMQGKAVDVINEAIYSALTYGEVRLGPNARASIAEMQMAVAKAATKIEKEKKPVSLFQFLVGKGGIKDEGGELAARNLRFGVSRNALVRKTGMSLDKARGLAVEAGYISDAGRDTGGLSTTTVDDLLEALDREHSGQRVYSRRDEMQAVRYEQNLRAETANPEAKLKSEIPADVEARINAVLADMGLDSTSFSKEEYERAAELIRNGMNPDEALIRAGQETTDLFDETRGFGMAKPLSFYEPPPFPVSKSFTDSISKVEANVKPVSDIAARAIEDAKLEGFDPETGQHDLQDEINMLKEQGVLTPEDVEALKAADDNFASATAWEDVMQVARNCVLK